jgi:hypothetical protein
VERWLGTLANEAPWRFSTWARCACGSAHPDQKSTEVALALAWSGQAIRSGMLPRQTDVAEQWPSQPELPAGGGDQAGPAVGGSWVARADSGPAKRLFEEAEGVLDRKAPQVPAPEDAQVGWEWTADPSQPEGARRQPRVGQAFDLDARDAERRIRRAGHVEIRPGIDLHVAVDGVVQALCVLCLAVGVVLGQPKRLTMQARPTTTSVPAQVGDRPRGVWPNAPTGRRRPCCAQGFPGRSHCRASPPDVAPVQPGRDVPP